LSEHRVGSKKKAFNHGLIGLHKESIELGAMGQQLIPETAEIDEIRPSFTEENG
jgi:hypothetical protein